MRCEGRSHSDVIFNQYFQLGIYDTMDGTTSWESWIFKKRSRSNDLFTNVHRFEVVGDRCIDSRKEILQTWTCTAACNLPTNPITGISNKTINQNLTENLQSYVFTAMFRFQINLNYQSKAFGRKVYLSDKLFEGWKIPIK